MTDEERVTYRSVLRSREYSAILVGHGLSAFGDQVARVALAVLVFRETHSPFAASATFAVTLVGELLAGPFVSTLSDRLTRRTVMVTSDVARGALMLVLALPRLPIPALFVLLALFSVLTPAFDSARSATLPDVLPGEAYAKGQAIFNVTFQAAQVPGFVAGGALLTAFTVSQLLILNASTFFISGGLILGAVLKRPPLAAEGERPHLVRDTAEGLRIVLGDWHLRRLLTYALLGAAAVAAPEALAVPIADELKGGTVAAGFLTASIPAGFVVASFFILRLSADRREESLRPLAILATLPLLLTPLAQSVPVMTALWVASGLGTSLQLVAAAAYGLAAPPHARARAFGLAAAGLIAVQGATQLFVGALAGPFGSRTAVSAFALIVLLLLLLTGRFSLQDQHATQENQAFVRGNA